MAEIINARLLRIVPLLFAVCMVSLAAQAAGGASTYIFLSDQSTVVQTGGIAGVHRTYVIEGQFQLSVDPNAGIATFVHVDANATDDSPYRRNLDPNEVFNMTGLVGTVIGDTIIIFSGKATDNSDVLIIAIFNNDLVYLVGQTFPPAGSADFFIFSLDAVAQRKYAGGNGTAEDPYQITTAEDLILLGDNPEDYDKHFILTADIDLDPNLPGRKVFDRAVIGAFTGVFDGNGHSISNLTITGTGFLGLIGRLASGAEVRNMGVVDVNIVGSSNYVGGLVGSNGGAAINCYSDGTVTGNYWVGGLVGSNGRTLTYCYSTITVSGGSEVGGLVGMNCGTVTQCYSTGAVSGNDAVGGLVGCNGILGWEPYPGYIDKSYSSASVRGENAVGGLVGDNTCGDVKHCYSTGTVIGHRYYVGGLVGWIAAADISNCYSTGLVIGTGEYIGGLVGGGWSQDVTASFWDIQTSGQATSAGGMGKTTAEMQTASTFLDAGWDFVGETANGIEDIWWILEGQDYPRLWWQAPEQ